MNPLHAVPDPAAAHRGPARDHAGGDPARGRRAGRRGFRVLEVPLNSPRAFDSIRLLADGMGRACLVGAGTVLAVDDVARVRDGRRTSHRDAARGCRGRFAQRRRRAWLCVPGVATPTEAFAALAAGADGLKMFPAEALPPAALKAWRAVLPPTRWCSRSAA